MMEYRGYFSGPIDIDPDDGTLSGMVAGITDVIHFEGRTAEELLVSFRGGVDDYLAHCDEVGKTPERPYSGKLSLRLTPELHRKAAMKAQATGVSLNVWLSRQIEAA
jgi:predicted HicB family RNase H-like nuclease